MNNTDTLRERREIRGLTVTCFRQNEVNILCKIGLTPNDVDELCERTKSGLFKNKEFHDRFINMIVTRLDAVMREEKEKTNGTK
jgi:hypothetical protein